MVDMLSIDEQINKVWHILQTIHDPEIPVISIIDLGIVRKVELIPSTNTIQIGITPTYSGCPAIDAIKFQIRLSMLENNIDNFSIEQILSPAWTTHWITEKGKQQMLAYGIAPPVNQNNFENNVVVENITCPQCTSTNTILVSQFGSTACKALYKCNNCLEPFDYFKCH